MKQNNYPNDPIQEIAEKLREHTVPYKEGSWERFKELEGKKKKFILWPYLSAAAVLLIAFTLFSLPKESKDIAPELTSKQVISQKKDLKEEVVINEEPLSESLYTEENKQNIYQKHEILEEEVISGSLLANQVIDNTAEAIYNAEINTSQESIQLVESVISQPETSLNNVEDSYAKTQSDDDAIEPKTKAKEKKSQDFLAELLKVEKEERVAFSKVEDRKWSVGLDVASNMSSNNDVNIGGGLAIGYAVSPKVSLSSGISYLHVNAEREIGAVNSKTMQASPNSTSGALPLAGRRSTKILRGVDASLIGLDIPLAINYHISPKVYASAGVSVFNVLNERQDNIYENSNSDVLFIASDSKGPEPVVQTFSSRERTVDKNYEGKGLSGFYNFSVGYAVPVSSKVDIAIEPFYKIPMTSNSGSELNLSNGGIKISTRF